MGFSARPRLAGANEVAKTLLTGLPVVITTNEPFVSPDETHGDSRRCVPARPEVPGA